jgi:hypothetical protein
VEREGAEFAARLPALEGAGTHILNVRLAGETPEGLPYLEERSVQIQVLMGEAYEPPQRAWWPLVVLVIGGGLGAGGWALTARRRRPRLVGQWRVLSGPGEGTRGRVLALPPTRSSQPLDGEYLPGLRLEGEPQASVRVQARQGEAGSVEVWLEPLRAEASEPVCLNRRPLNAAQRLHDGDLVAVGAYRLRYENVREAAQRRAGRSFNRA